MDMIERVAKAIKEKQATPHTDEEVARAAIEALRYPTDAMIEALHHSLADNQVTPVAAAKQSDEFRAGIAAMIDAALSPPPHTEGE